MATRASTSAGAQQMPSTLPVATYDILQSLSRSKVFATTALLVRPDTSDEDTREGRQALSQRATFIRIVLGGWLTALAGEEGKNGCQASIATSETVTILTSAIAGPLHYIKSKPSVLLFLPPTGKSNATGNPDSELIVDANVDGISLGDGDLASFLLPRVLRATASLEGALLSTDRPLDDVADVKAQLWRDRLQLKLNLEELLYEVVRILAVSGTRLTWRPRELSALQGGLGKAREMVQEMVKLLKSLLPSAHDPAPTFPRAFPFPDYGARRSAGAPTSDPAPSIPIQSNLQARGLLLSTLRILRRLVETTPLLSDFGPALVDVFVESWPSAYAGPGDKGKQAVSVHQDRILEATLVLAETFLARPLPAIELQSTALIADRVTNVLKFRIASDPMDVDEPDSDERIDACLARIMAHLWTTLRETEEGDGGQATLAHVITMAVIQCGEQMVDCITSEERSSTLQLCSVFALACPLMPRPSPSGAKSSLAIETTPAVDLLPENYVHHLATFASTRPTLPCDIPSFLVSISSPSEVAWCELSDILRAKLGHPTLPTQAARKRRRNESQHPTSDVADDAMPTATGSKRKKATWMDSVAMVLRQMKGGGELNLQSEGLEHMVVRLAKSLATSDADQALSTLRALSLVGCARDGSLTFCPVPDDPSLPPEPVCSFCDSWATAYSGEQTSSISEEPTVKAVAASRVFTEAPLNAMRDVVRSVLTPAGNENIRLAFLKAVARLFHHSKCSTAAYSLVKPSPLLSQVWTELEAPTRPLRLAAGHVIVALVQAHQANNTDDSTQFTAALVQQLDVFLNHKQPSVVESALVTTGRLLQASTRQGLLECRCLERLVSGLGHSNTFLKSFSRTQLDQAARDRGVKPYALVQPHFASIAPLLVHSRQHTAILAAAVDCFRQPREALLKITREFTLPAIVVNGDRVRLEQIAAASGTSISAMLLDVECGPGIVAFLYTRPLEADRHRGLAFYLREVQTEGTGWTLAQIYNQWPIRTMYTLVLALGDEDRTIQDRAERGIQEYWRKMLGLANNVPVDVGAVLKDSIVGLLSHINRSLNEPASHRSLSDKQRNLRGLEAVTKRVGTGMAGFSPQILATLQTAIEVEGLRSVSLHAFKVYIETLKFSEIGPFLGTMSATFVRLWPSFSPAERLMATETIEYVVVHHADDLAKFGQDIADLGDIPELAKASARLRESRHAWTFPQRCESLLLRVGSENDVVALQGAKELKNLFESNRRDLQALSAGDSFDRLVGNIVKTLFAVAVKDGDDQADDPRDVPLEARNVGAQTRNVALECIGMLGALDPDRFELPPTDPPFIVTRNFEDHEESVAFALHLIQDLLVGAYRTTNATRHQESLAFAIQELLKFCEFTDDLVNPSKPAKPVDSLIKKRWSELPKSVLETCGPLLGSRFKKDDKSVPLPPPSYPIYSSKTSYRDWIRSWANDLIEKAIDTNAKKIFDAFPPALHLDDIGVAQHLLPHLVLNVLISGQEEDRQRVQTEIGAVLEDQVSPKDHRNESSRLLSAQTVFDLMDHLSRWITKARKSKLELAERLKKTKGKASTNATNPFLDNALLRVELVLSTIPHILVGEAALKCKAFARSLLNFESHIVAQKKDLEDDTKLQDYYENLHQCYAALDEPDGMEGISTKILSPSLAHQIREHESTGRWTSAQSCWEVKLQDAPDNSDNHVGLLRCLRNLGHYDSMRTHIVGILHNRSDQAEWNRILAPFNIEASLIVGDWGAVEQTLQIPGVVGPEVTFGKVIGAMYLGDTTALEQACSDGREELGVPIIAAGRESYRRVYDAVVHLHILHEISEIYHSRLHSAWNTTDQVSPLVDALRARLDSTSPSFRAREPILNKRRTVLRLVPTEVARREIAELWLETSKIARKAGHSQTAYSAILQARDLSDSNDPKAPFVFLQSAKLLMAGDEPYKAIQTIDNALRSRIPAEFSKPNAVTETSPLVSKKGTSVLAKASLRRARWMHEAGRLEADEIAVKYLEAARLAPDWESPHYYLGRYHDDINDSNDKKGDTKAHRRSQSRDRKGDPAKKTLEFQRRLETCRQFSRALLLGNKFIYQAMPRMITIWLECGEERELIDYMKSKKKDKTLAGNAHEAQHYSAFLAINEVMARNVRKLSTYQWLTVLPQLVSRILHQNDDLIVILEQILVKVLQAYPHQGFWAMASGAKSQTSKRARRCQKVLTRAEGKDAGSGNTVSAIGTALVDQLLDLCNHPIQKTDPLSLRVTFPDLYRLAPMRLIIPLQSSLNVMLPSDASQTRDHNPFPGRLPVFQKFDDTVHIMPSLQRPRKISVWGDDGIMYSFLCKPKDDLRKDARLMEFNSMIIKLLKKDSDARNRRLTIRTYSVVPLNEECGLIEWVPHVVVLRSVLNKLYARHNVQPWSPELKRIFDTIRDVPEKTAERFEKEVLPKFKPVFHEWFLDTFPEPSAWLRARLAYSRTAAVISMVGFVLGYIGLGDRHCENILLDATTGDTVHVDFNCLFDRGRTFEVAEQVPFRLTTNIIAGMGVTGVEGVFRRAAEISLGILRNNKDSLMSVLETFLHDPLVEWNTKRMMNTSAAEQASFIQRKAQESLDPISNKLRGLQVTSDPLTKGDTEVDVAEQVERLIRDARNSKNLGSMYVGWSSWY